MFVTLLSRRDLMKDKEMDKKDLFHPPLYVPAAVTDGNGVNVVQEQGEGSGTG